MYIYIITTEFYKLKLAFKKFWSAFTPFFVFIESPFNLERFRPESEALWFKYRCNACLVSELYIPLVLSGPIINFASFLCSFRKHWIDRTVPVCLSVWEWFSTQRDVNTKYVRLLSLPSYFNFFFCFVPVFERWCSSLRHNRIRIQAFIFSSDFSCGTSEQCLVT